MVKKELLDKEPKCNCSSRRGILEFDLPEEQDIFTVCAHATDLIYGIEGFSNYLRSLYKYNFLGELTEHEAELIEAIREKFYEDVGKFTSN